MLYMTKMKLQKKSNYNTKSVLSFTFVLVVIFVILGLLPAFLESMNEMVMIVGALSIIVLSVFKGLSLRKYASKINVYTQKRYRREPNVERSKKIYGRFLDVR